MKEEVKDKIKYYCEKYNLEVPKNWSYQEVKDISKKINDRASAESWERELNRLQDNEHLWK